MDKLLQKLEEDNKCRSNKRWPNDSSWPNDSRPNKIWPNDSRPNKFWPNDSRPNKIWPNDSSWPNELWQTIKKLKLFSGSFDTTGVFKFGTIATFEFSAKLTIGKKLI
jgi:hypothetical protein